MASTLDFLGEYEDSQGANGPCELDGLKFGLTCEMEVILKLSGFDRTS